VVGLLNEMAPKQEVRTFYTRTTGGGRMLVTGKHEQTAGRATFERVNFHVHIGADCQKYDEIADIKKLPCRLSIATAIRWLTNHDILTTVPARFDGGFVSPNYDVLWSDDAWKRCCRPVLKLCLDEEGMLVPLRRKRQCDSTVWTRLIGQEIVVDQAYENLDRSQLWNVMEMIHAHNPAARSMITATVMSGIFASLVIHLTRFPKDSITVCKFIRGLMSVLCIAHRRLLYLCRKGPWRAIKCDGIGLFIQERIAMYSRQPSGSSELLSQWPFAPGSMIVLCIPFEEANELGLRLQTEETFLYRGTVYVGPNAVNRVRRASMHQLCDRLCTEISTAADYARGDPDVREKLTTLAIPLTFGEHEKRMSTTEINDVFDDLPFTEFRNEQRKKVAMIISRELTIDQRSRRMQFLEEMLVNDPHRLKELKAWIKFYDDRK
jgi:hypothetical protein